jgi:DNA-binding winged helix-turn-helix (wHTH) protein/Flp pilus assembly protein TadD
MLENSSRKSQEILNRHGRLRFASFEVDLEERELRKAGARLPLQHKPFRILELLLRQPGSLVTRKELAKDLWPNLHVSFERSLNSAINSLRQVLGDSSRECRFIETRSGLGYRFIAPVEEMFLPAHAAHANSGAYHDCLRGKFFLNKMTGEGRQRAIGCFQAALNEDARYALAHAGLADVHCQLALSGTAPAADLRRSAREFASASLSDAPNLPDAHVSFGRVLMIFDWDWGGALAALNHAATLHPELPEAHSSRALLLCALGRHDEALREIRRAQVLDPLALPIGQEFAWIFYVSAAHQEAVEQCWKVLSLEPRCSEAQSILGLAYRQLGLLDEAITELQNAYVCSDRHPSAIATLGHIYATAGFPGKAADLLAELAHLSQRNYVSPYCRAIVHAGLGDRKSAVDELQTAFSQRDPLLLWLGVDPRLASLRQEASFASLRRRLGFD